MKGRANDSSDWLPPTNRVHRDGFYRLPRAHPYSGAILRDVLRYGAVSVVLNCGDAWSYFSRGVSALASGNLEIAQHLFYYSELRAAGAILQRHGVFTFDGNNFVVDSRGDTHSLNATLRSPGTHQATWPIFEAWINVSAPNFLAKELMYLGHTLDDWRQALPSAGSFDAIISSLIRAWGVDLLHFSEDRKLRNRLSYNPARIKLDAQGHSPSTILFSLQEAWTLLEPAGANAFETFDGYLIREIVAQNYAGRHSQRALTSEKYREEVAVTLETVLGHAQPAVLDSFCEPNRPALEFLTFATTDPADTSVTLRNRLVGMMGRSLVMLRMATGAAASMREAAQIEPATVDAWASDMLGNRGVQPPPGSPRDYRELWSDVQMDLEDLADLEHQDRLEDMPKLILAGRQVNSLTTFERVPAWAVA